MFIPRFADCCVLCLKEPPFPDGSPLTVEHVIPAALGGILSSDMLCKTCNSELGHGTEAHAKADPAIRLAVGNLKNQLPELHASIEEGQPYVIKSAVGFHRGIFRSGEIIERTEKLPDSILSAERHTRGILKGLLAKEGHEQVFIAAALQRYDEAQEEVPFSITPGLTVIKRVAHHEGPALADAPALNPLVPLKIAYEFAVLMLGRPLLKCVAPLNEVRTALLARDKDATCFEVEELIGKDYAPIHGIVFEGNDPHATIQVRLFGRLAYRVHLKRLAFDMLPTAYTHDLLTGDERVDEVAKRSGGTG